MSMKEWLAALRGYNKANQPSERLKPVEPMNRKRLEELMEQYPDG